MQGDLKDLQHQGFHRGLVLALEANHKSLGIGAGSWKQMGQELPPMQKNSPNSSCSNWPGDSNNILYLSFTFLSMK